MYKKELIERLAAESNISKKTAAAVVNQLFEQMSVALANGEKLRFPGFGTFEVRDRVAKQGRNPQTGEAIQVPARKAVTFRPGKPLKDAVNS